MTPTGALALAYRVIEKLLAVLPDNCEHDEDPSWEWCWNELSGGAQERVKGIRREAQAFLFQEPLTDVEKREAVERVVLSRGEEMVKAWAHLYEVRCQSGEVDDSAARDRLMAAYDEWLG